MKIEIKLHEPNYCNGCPLLDMGEYNNKWNWCMKYKEQVKSQLQPLKEIKGRVGRKRLAICKRQNGN